MSYFRYEDIKFNFTIENGFVNVERKFLFLKKEAFKRMMKKFDFDFSDKTEKIINNMSEEKSSEIINKLFLKSYKRKYKKCINFETLEFLFKTYSREYLISIAKKEVKNG